MPRLTRARASDLGLFLAIAAALHGFAAGAALAKDPSGRAEDEMNAAVVPDSARQGARRGQAEDQLDSSEEPWSSVADTARDVARYAVDAAREASRATETTLRAMGQSHAGVAAVLPRRSPGRGRLVQNGARSPTDMGGALQRLGVESASNRPLSARGRCLPGSARPKSRLRRAWNGLGSALFEGGERADARTAFQRADRLGPNDEIVREGLRRASL
jgi:hypothetical protein